MANLIEIIIKATGQSSVNAAMKEATGGVKTFQDGLLGLDDALGQFGMGLGLAGLTTAATAWVAQAVQGAAEDERLARTFTNVAGGAEQAASYIGALARGSKAQVEDTAQMSVGLDILNLKLVDNAAEMEQFIEVSRRLGEEFSGMDFEQAVSGFTRVQEMGSTSARFLMQYGISADNVKQRMAELQAANTSLTDIEAARQAIMQEAIATYDKLGPQQRDIISGQREMAAAAADFQDAFGAAVLSMGSSLGVFDAATNALRNLQGGAEAWTTYNQRTQEGGDALRTTQQDLINSTSSLDEYNAAVTRAIQEAGPLAEIFGMGRELYLTAQQYQAMKAGLDAVRTGAGQASSDVGRYNTVLAASTGATATAKAAATGYSNALRTVAMTQEQVNQKLDEYRNRMAFAGSPYSTAIAQANQLDSAWGVILAKSAEYRNGLMQSYATTSPYAAGVTTANTQAQITQQTESRKLMEDAAREQQDAVKEAADSLRSVIESVMQPTLAEVWKPPEGMEARIDEDARRLAAVAVRGFGEKGWLDTLTAEYGGMSFWQPILDAMGQGDEGALKAAAANILTAQAPMLWDVPTIVQKVKDSLAQQDARTQVMNAVMAELTGQGIAVNAEEVTAAMGGGGMAGIAGMLTGNLATDMQNAVNQSGASQSMVLGLRDGVLKANKETTALASAIANSLDKAWADVTKQSASTLIQALVTEVKNQLGDTKAATAAGAGAGGGNRP